MGYLDELEAAKVKARAIVAKEKSVLSLDKIERPTQIDKLLTFDFSMMDTLTGRELEQFIGMLSQHLIYANKYVNQLSIIVSVIKKFYNNVLDIEALKEDGKSVKEREIKARVRVAEIPQIEEELLKEETRLAVYSNTIDQMTQHLQTLKKVYDARIKEAPAAIPN